MRVKSLDFSKYTLKNSKKYLITVIQISITLQDKTLQLLRQVEEKKVTELPEIRQRPTRVDSEVNLWFTSEVPLRRKFQINNTTIIMPPSTYFISSTVSRSLFFKPLFHT